MISKNHYSNCMGVYINDIATAVPSTFEEQQTLREIMKNEISDDRKTRSIIHRIYTQSAIEKRHIAKFDYHSGGESTSFIKRAFLKEDAPSTKERNELYQHLAVPLYIEVAKKLLSANPEFTKENVTHVITVSCTGFFAPGPDFELVRQLGLSASTQRFHVGFMGCYAMFPALRMAKAFCEADPDAVVLVVSCELCTLHLQAKSGLDDLIASSVFADGASGVLVSSQKPAKSGFELNQFTSALAYEGEKDMAWTIGDTGFNMILSSYVPEIIEAHLSTLFAPMFKSLSVSTNDIALWAVHPGGRAIIDKVEQSMNLQPHQVAPSRTVLAHYGNMSSSTILFVLDEIRKTTIQDGERVVPIAFGPGLTIETGMFNFVRS